MTDSSSEQAIKPICSLSVTLHLDLLMCNYPFTALATSPWF